MGGRVGLGKEICEVHFPGSPLEFEMSHGDAVLEPMVSSSNSFGTTLFAPVVGDVTSDCVVVVDNGWGLGYPRSSSVWRVASRLVALMYKAAYSNS